MAQDRKNKLGRRSFLLSAGALGAAPLLGCAASQTSGAAASTSRRPAAPSELGRRRLGELEVSSVGLGMTHVAVSEHLEGRSVDWLEKVTDAEYGAPATARPATAATTPARAGAASQPSRAQQLFGDISPKMVELTDGVLFGDIWERPGLAKRDRSLVTVSALIAMNRPDQLRSHFALARTNGVTREELIETITHLAFYAGWPSAVTALGVAKEVFDGKK